MIHGFLSGFWTNLIVLGLAFSGFNSLLIALSELLPLEKWHPLFLAPLVIGFLAWAFKASKKHNAKFRWGFSLLMLFLVFYLNMELPLYFERDVEMSIGDWNWAIFIGLLPYNLFGTILLGVVFDLSLGLKPEEKGV